MCSAARALLTGLQSAACHGEGLLEFLSLAKNAFQLVLERDALLLGALTGKLQPLPRVM
jgi:hypothetical protein